MVPLFQHTESIADYYRRRAEEALRAAKNSASNPELFQEYLALAEQWSRLEARHGVTWDARFT